MKTINLNFPICDLKGVAILEGGNEVLASQIVSSQLSLSTKNTAKFMGWAIKLINKENLVLDNADLNSLVNFMENEATIPNLSKWPISEYLKKVRSAKEEAEGKA